MKYHHCYGNNKLCLLQQKPIKVKWLVFHWCLYNKHYMASWRYEICLLMLKNISLIHCAH